MRSKILVFLFALASSALVPAQLSYFYTVASNAPIPASGTGGASGGCTNSANKTLATVTAPDPYKITEVQVGLHLDHTYAHDLRITLSHGTTSVVLFDQHAATVGKAFQGYYGFKDDAFATIAAAVNQNLPALVNGNYQPASPLSAFNGASSAGPWTLEICDLSAVDSGVLIDFSVYVAVGKFFQNQFTANIADGSAGGCVAPVTAVINVPSGIGRVSRVYCAFSLSHARAADLEMTLTHGPVSVTLASANTPPSPIAALAWYAFDDWASETWDQGLLSFNLSIPSSDYRPDSPLSTFDGVDATGSWFLTVCDAIPGNTGSIFNLEIGFALPAYDFTLTQPAGTSSIVLKNTGGYAGNHYLNAFTLVPGSYPGGWLNGLDIAIGDLVTQISWGVPFFGTLDASGSAIVTIPGPIPSSLPLQFTSFEVSPQGLPLASIPARTYTTAP